MANYRQHFPLQFLGSHLKLRPEGRPSHCSFALTNVARVQQQAAACTMTVWLYLLQPTTAVTQHLKSTAGPLKIPKKNLKKNHVFCLAKQIAFKK